MFDGIMCRGSEVLDKFSSRDTGAGRYLFTLCAWKFSTFVLVVFVFQVSCAAASSVFLPFYS